MLSSSWGLSLAPSQRPKAGECFFFSLCVFFSLCARLLLHVHKTSATGAVKISISPLIAVSLRRLLLPAVGGGGPGGGGRIAR